MDGHVDAVVGHEATLVQPGGKHEFENILQCPAASTAYVIPCAHAVVGHTGLHVMHWPVFGSHTGLHDTVELSGHVLVAGGHVTFMHLLSWPAQFGEHKPHTPFAHVPLQEAIKPSGHVNVCVTQSLSV